MKTSLPTLAALLLALCSTMQTQAQSTNAPLASDRFQWRIQRSGELPFLLHLPAEYSAKPGERWPLMLFLHGAGERGDDVQRVALHGPMKLVKQGTNFPFIIVAPVCPAGQLWENEPLLQLLDHIEAKYAVATNRVYLTGLSMGGYGTWKLGFARPERFAAIAPICGGGSWIDAALGSPARMEALRTLPVWAFHGAKDPVVRLDESERMVAALRTRAGNQNVQLTIYPEAQHDAWTETYNNPKFYEWLLKQSR